MIYQSFNNHDDINTTFTYLQDVENSFAIISYGLQGSNFVFLVCERMSNKTDQNFDYCAQIPIYIQSFSNVLGHMPQIHTLFTQT